MFKKSIAIVIVLLAIFTVAMAFAEDTTEQVQKPAEQPKHRVFTMQDNSFSYQFGSHFRDPFIAKYDTSGNLIGARYISKNIVEFKHIDIGNKFGDNLFIMSYLQSNRNNPVSSDHFHGLTDVGAKDVYMIYRHTISLGRLTGKDLSFGPIKDITIVMGADFGTKNDDFANQRRSPMVGPGIAFKVPNHGFANFSAMWTREWNNEGTDVTQFNYVLNTHKPGCSSTSANPYCYIPTPSKWGQKIVYDPSVTFQANWGVPFRLGRAPMSFEGFATLNAAKGYGAPELETYSNFALTDGVNNNQNNTGTKVWERKGTKPELIIHPVLNYNVGSLFGEGHNWQIGFGYEFWNNMFGVDHHKYPGCVGNSPFLNLTIHL